MSFVLISTLLLIVCANATRVLRVAPHTIRSEDVTRSSAQVDANTYNATTHSGDVEVVADGVINAHVVMVPFGDSPRNARLLIDTGSPDTLVMVANVDTAAVQDAPTPPRSFADFLPFIGPILFDLRLSPTGRNVSCANVAALNASWCANELLKFDCDARACVIGEMYGDGSLRLGAVERDVVDLGARTDMYFLRALRVGSGHLSMKTDNAIEGILGLSPSDGVGHLPATLDQLRDGGAIAHRVFGLCLPDPASPFDSFESADYGDLVVGAPHDLSMLQLAANREFSVPLHTNTTWYADNGTFVPRYLVQVNGASVGTAAIPMSVLALVDSGSVRTILPAPVFDAIANAYVAACATWTHRTMLCPPFGESRIRKLFGEASFGRWAQYAIGGLTEEDISQFPPISFDLGGGKVQIDWRHLFMRQDDLLALTLSRGSDAMPMTVLGNSMMRAYRTVFDVDSQTITFATPNVCSKHVHRPLPPWMIIVGATVGGVVVILVCVVVVCLCRRRRRVRQESLLDAAAREPAADNAEPATAPASTADAVPAPFVRV